MARYRNAILAAGAAMAGLQGCACDTLPDGALTDCEQSRVFAGTVKTDILFVIDDSVSMGDEQGNLRTGLNDFIVSLSASPIADDYRIGVTTTSVREFDATAADYATFTSGPSAGLPYPAGALVSVDPTNLVVGTVSTYGDFFYDNVRLPPGPGFHGPRDFPYQYIDSMVDDGTGAIVPNPNLVADFQNDVLVGTNGSAREQPFEAMRLALSDHLGTNPFTAENTGFLRPGARLAILFLSDEDDCSGPTGPGVTTSNACATVRGTPGVLTPVQEYVDFLKGPVGGERRDVVVGAVVGVTCSAGSCLNDACPTAWAYGKDLTPADRFIELVGAFDPARSALASICATDFSAALEQFADVVMSQSLPLEGDVADYRMLVVKVTSGASTRTCTVEPVGSTAAAGADVIYTASNGDYPARLTFQNGCTLAPGDSIDIDVICAG